MRNRSGWWMIIVVMVLIDLYVFQVVKSLTAEAAEKTKLIVYSIYWVISVAAICSLLILPYFETNTWPKTIRNYIFALVAGIFIAKLFATIFFLLDDIRRGITWIISRIFPENDPTSATALNTWNLNRSAFLSWLGVGVGGTFLGIFTYGFSNKYNYKIKRIKLTFNNLPQAFKGLKIVQISDIHSGSFGNKAAVQHGVDMVMKENADLVFFTGDLVNDRAIEMDNYMDVFNQIKAPMGVFSTLGNHDYGDYVKWESEEAKRMNLKDLMHRHSVLGWRLLMNEHVALEKNGEQIAILGVENWSAKSHFPKYGRLDKAYKGTEKYPFKILLSHDPTHWDAQVRPNYGDIDLMLAGHTHGMQFGLETPFFKWSPVQWVYKQWAGLYKEGNQVLYVNRGYGFIGYPGRVGILPEITVFTLA